MACFVPVVRYKISIGSSMTAPRATRINAPSAIMAVLSATNEFSREPGVFPQVLHDRRRLIAETARFEPLGRLSGRLSRWPLAKTS